MDCNRGKYMTSFQINEKTEAFLSTYNLFEGDQIQHVQLQHRLELVQAFDIQEGMRILEIGCGQGDTTVALADAVGETGFVVAVDIASRDYGAPSTLGEATDLIKKSILGERISFHFEMDIDRLKLTEPFDAAVLSHCSWYFKQPKDLLHCFKLLRNSTKRICFAEWDLDFTDLSQRSHFCAATIQALYSNFISNEGNIQNLFNKVQVQKLLEQAGFAIENQLVIEAAYLQDAIWEKEYANSIHSEFSSLSVMLQTLIASYYDLMNSMNDNEQSLNSFVLCGK